MRFLHALTLLSHLQTLLEEPHGTLVQAPRSHVLAQFCQTQAQNQFRSLLSEWDAQEFLNTQSLELEMKRQ